MLNIHANARLTALGGAEIVSRMLEIGDADTETLWVYSVG